MPLREFRCNLCKWEWEVQQKMDDPKPICPECRCPDVEQIHTATGGFELKGKGWFKDGYS